MRPRVVIVGAGFGGLQAGKKLAGHEVDVTLIDRNNYHLFTPLLYQVASSLLNPSDIAYPIRAVFRHKRNVRFHLGDVSEIDYARKIVRLADGDEIPYDYLVLATGTADNYFGLSSVQQVACGLKDLPKAIALRSHVIRVFEAAAQEQDPERRKEWLRFLVVGGGPTGVEYAGALTELVQRVLRKDYPELDMSDVRVILVEALGQVLAAFPPKLGQNAQRRLEKMGVEVRLNTRVQEATDQGVTLAGGEVIKSRTLVWAAGVKPTPPSNPEQFSLTRSRRIVVDQYLRIADRPGVFAVGDIAAFMQDGRELGMMAPQAMQAGRHAARVILAQIRNREPKPFRYFDKGTMATIGRHAAVAQVGKITLSGLIGWVAWLFLHLYYITGYRNRLAVFAHWIWNYFFYDRPIRLLTDGRDGWSGNKSR